MSTVAEPARAVIVKSAKDWSKPPNMSDYARTRTEFSWDAARAALDGLPGGGLNIAYEAVDRHAQRTPGAVALRWLGKKGERRGFTYGELRDLTNRFAAALRELGIEPGERVFALLGRTPELYTTAFGTLKAGSVFCPLFSAFGPDPVRERMRLGSGVALVTTRDLYRKKVAPIRSSLPDLRHVIFTDGLPDDAVAGAHSMHDLLAAAAPRFEVWPTQPSDVAILHFTSGTTGRPKGAIHVHEAVVGHYATARFALDLQPGDIFWCTADPGWVTGTSYGIIAPLVLGITMVVDEAEFDAVNWFETLERERVSVWYTAPTAIRRLMRLGPDPAADRDLSALRFIASVGEPLNPEAVVWGEEALGLPIHDNWWQTETGGIMIGNFAATDIRPGSMGLPLPGVEAAIARRTSGGELVVQGDGPGFVREPSTTGELVLRAGWPSMFRGYLGDEERYRKAFCGDWYRTGDLARRDADGYFWFVGRGDDVIKSAGHLIGPFEVESVLMEHPAVADAGVIGVPDPVAGERVKAYVLPAAGNEPTEELRRELLGFARKRLGSAVAPKEIVFTDSVPHTRSGKTMRRLLRARDLGLPEGDLSTLESES